MMKNRPTLADAKKEAKRLRSHLSREGEELSHAQALEKVAHQHGFRDWNAFHAAIASHEPDGWHAGGRVTGHYLSQPFTSTVLDANALRPGWYRLVLDLDEAVDVVRFDSFSNMRKRLHVVVGPDGHSRECTSDGVPHVRLDLT